MRPSAYHARFVALLTGLVLYGSLAPAAVIVLRDGRVLDGKIATVSSLAEDPRDVPPPAGAPQPKLIVFCDDDLRRTFVPKQRVLEVREGGGGEVLEKFQVHQVVGGKGGRVYSVGGIIDIEPFDEFGRRIFRMQTQNGALDVIQGITLITPRWTKVEGLSHQWDMRMATSAIPRATLDAIVSRQLDAQNVEHRLKIARLYLQSERYTDAREELEEIIRDFPDLEEQIGAVVVDLRQMSARRLLEEVRVRRDAGQHLLAYDILEQFPSENVAGEIMQEVRELIEFYAAEYEQGERARRSFEEHVAACNDEALAKQIEPIQAEIFTQLDNDTLVRLQAYLQFVDDPGLLPTDRLALAISGWMVGADNATDTLPVALSMVRVRDLIWEYLNEPTQIRRDMLRDKMLTEEAAAPERVAQILEHMRPPVALPTADTERPGYYEITIPGIESEPEFTYSLQLPPEYDPYRRYPTVVTLHSGRTTPGQQIDWWAGGWNDRQQRLGQGTRHGYIVIAPHWGNPGQVEYEYSARAHATVLYCLRDAMRRTSIDADRVFLSGHSMGADAAWDLGLAHPDLWAGVIPIVGQSDRYCSLYWPNAQHLGFYVIGGELDGRSLHNARDLDRYMTRGYDVTFVEYLGRGHENFSDEVLRVFEWMAHRSREFFPREFTCKTMRAWDNYFWWLEVEDFPQRAVADPLHWPPPRGTRPMDVSGKVTNTGRVFINTGTTSGTIWLSPQLVDLGRRVQVHVNGRRIASNDVTSEPKLTVMLEDVRTRGDRQHPFWARIDFGR